MTSWSWVQVLVGIHPAFHPSGVDTVGTEFLVGKVKPPGVAPWLFRRHEIEQFDEIVLRPKAEVSAVLDLLPFTFYLYFLKRRRAALVKA